MMMILPLLLSLFLAFTTPSSSLSDNGHLLSVHIVFRHGEHEPTESDFQPKSPTDYRVDPYAKLTKTGRKQSHELGKYLRSRYYNSFFDHYERGDVHLQSTHTEHARESLRCMLNGLYPAQLEQEWSPNFECQFHAHIVSPEKHDDPVMWPIKCPAYQVMRKLLKMEPMYMAEINDLLDQIASSKKFDRILPEVCVMESFTEGGKLNCQLGNLWTKYGAEASYYDVTRDQPLSDSKVNDERAEFLPYQLQNYNEHLIRLNGGMLLRKIIDDMDVVMNGGIHVPTIGIYAGQEFNLISLLYALNVDWSPVVPNHSSAVIVELRQKDRQHYINVLYRDGFNDETKTLKIRNCIWKKMCHFDAIPLVLEPYLPSGVEECDRLWKFKS